MVVLSRYTKTASGKDDDPTSAAISFANTSNMLEWERQGATGVGFNMSAVSSYNTCLAEHIDPSLLIRAYGFARTSSLLT